MFMMREKVRYDEKDGKSTEKAGSGAGERLLEAAIDVFGKHGYEAATTRMIAGEAGVNIAAIPYYYGGKEGLYRAVVSYIVEMVRLEAGGMVATVAGTSFDHSLAADRDQAFAILQTLLEKFVNFIVGSTQGQRIARIILREQMYPSSAYDLIFEGFMSPVLDTITKLVTAVSGESSARQAKLRAMTIMGQVLVFRFARETIVRSLDMEGYSAEELQEIRGIIIAHTWKTIKPDPGQL